jgi:DNA-binding NarL/FixJ family response regulator
MGSSPASILIADDHRLFSDAVAGMLRSGFGTIWQAFDAHELFYNIQVHAPDLLLLDINLPKTNGIEAARSIRQNMPTLKIILVTMYNHAHFIAEAETLGLEGYILKDSPSEVLIKGIHTVLAGNRYFDPKLQKPPALTNEFVKGFLISKREQEVIKGLISGKTAEQISDELCIAYETVKSHRRNIYLKLGINSLIELVHFGRTQGWVD